MKQFGNLLELLGAENTLKLIEAYGGTRIGVPKELPQAHPLRDLLGDSGFALLFQYFGGSEVLVPIARRWRVEFYAKHTIPTLTRAQIARKVGCTEKTVYAILRGEKRTAGQLTLSFD